MPFCPKCRGEFQDWVKMCPDCAVELVHKLQPLPEPVNNKLRDEKLVTVARFSHPEEAYLASAKLESEGIQSFVADAHTVTADWLVSNAIGGVRLQVRESEAADAKQILSSKQQNMQATAAISETCPKCNSTDIQYQIFSTRPIFIVWLLTGGGLTFPFLKRKWICRACGYQWKNGK